MPRSMHLHTEIYPNLKTISEFTGDKPVFGPNCKIPYINLYMVSYSSDPKRA